MTDDQLHDQLREHLTEALTDIYAHEGRRTVAMIMLLMQGFRRNWFDAGDVPDLGARTVDEHIAWMLSRRPVGETYGLADALGDADRFAA